MLSRDALKELDDRIGIRRLYSDRNVDFFGRFGSLDWDRSLENFYLYYQRRVAVDLDSSSSISTLTVRAYSAKDAYEIDRMLLDSAERLINTMNERSRRDLVDVAEEEVHNAEKRTKDATVALASFRNSQLLFEPEHQSAIQLESVARLEEQVVATETQLEQVRRVSPANPQIASLRAQVDSLRRSIELETARVSGGKGSLSSKSSGYERLALEKEFAEKQLAAANIALESARNDAIRQELYLERLVQPSLPDKAMEPRRIRSIATVIALGFALWGVVSLIAASVREHMD
jgi:capsular polysaccharide transport system permease protein